MEPFLKWAGGKRWLISRPANLFPETINRYFEPFLGGGAVFFHIQPNNGYLSDINPDLINAYQVIRDDWESLHRLLTQYHNRHSKDFYYAIRSQKPRNPVRRAARFIYLNRTCWNGLYRVNRRGEFNVPIGSKNKVLLDDDNFQELSNILHGISIEACDFEVTMDRAQAGDFLFVDPPYTVKHDLNGFIKYNEKIFSWEDQLRLKSAIERALNRGVLILVLNAHHKSIMELYQGIGQMITLERASVIAGAPESRGVCNELAIKCW